MSKPFAGLRGIDFTQVLAGPYSTYQLASLGADVIKVEHPKGGDQGRSLLTPTPESAEAGMSALSSAVNSGKRSITVDLKHPNARDIIDRLVEKPSTKQLFDDYLINAGVYAIGPDVVDSIPATGTPDFAVDVFPHLLQRGDHLVGHRLMGQLLSTDTAERYQAACEQVAAGHFALP